MPLCGGRGQCQGLPLITALLPLLLGEGWGEGLAKKLKWILLSENAAQWRSLSRNTIDKKRLTPSQALIPSPSPKGRREKTKTVTVDDENWWAVIVVQARQRIKQGISKTPGF